MSSSQSIEQSTPEQEEAIWRGLLETERFWEERYGVKQSSSSASEVRDRANRITHVGHADFLIDVIRRRGGGVKRYENWVAVSSTPFCSEPGYESYKAVD